MEIYLAVKITGSELGAKIAIICSSETPLDKADTILVEGSSWDDVEKMMKSKILESQGRIEEAKAAREGKLN